MERVLLALLIPTLALLSFAGLLFGGFLYGMGMGAFSVEDYAVYEQFFRVAMVLGTIGLPTSAIFSVQAERKRWSGVAYAVAAALAVSPIAVFVAGTMALYG